MPCAMLPPTADTRRIQQATMSSFAYVLASRLGTGCENDSFRATVHDYTESRSNTGLYDRCYRRLLGGYEHSCECDSIYGSFLVYAIISRRSCPLPLLPG